MTDTREEFETRIAAEHSRIDDDHRFHDVYRTNLEPQYQQLSFTQNSTVDYAKMAMRSAFIMNGAAIIAVPTFANLTNSLDTELLVKSTCFFVLGLVSITLAMLFAYASLSRAAAMVHGRIDKMSAEVRLSRISDEESRKPVLDDMYKGYDIENRNWRKLQFWELAATIIGVASIVYFVLGALVGGYMMIL